MPKPASSHIIIPGETSWEIWSISSSQTTALASTHPVNFASEIDRIPSGDVFFFFPVRALTAIPLKVLTTDESLYQDLATTHAERLGLRPDPMAGQLTDIFPVSKTSDSSTIVSIVLRNPRTQDLPSKSPKAFDISPRSFVIRGNTLALWRELGFWTFALYLDGRLLYTQITTNSAPSPDQNLVRDIRLSIAQISLQDIDCAPSKAIVFTSLSETDTSLLARSFSLSAEILPRPTPTLPSALSKLLPADVRAARRAAQKRQNIILTLVLLAVLYIGTIGYFAFQVYDTSSKNKTIQTRIKQIAPNMDAFTAHNSKWEELQPALDLKYNTTDIWHRIQRCIPPNSGLRIKSADISPTNIVLKGYASEAQTINSFSVKLKQSNELVDFVWNVRPPTESDKTWNFFFDAAPPTPTPGRTVQIRTFLK